MSQVSIYTTAICPYCHAARRLLSGLGVEFEEIRLDGRPEERMRLSRENGGWRTVPMIFIGDRFVGGYSELRELHRSGELSRLLEPGGGREAAG